MCFIPLNTERTDPVVLVSENPSYELSNHVPLKRPHLICQNIHQGHTHEGWHVESRKE